jgi:hypothetical protein
MPRFYLHQHTWGSKIEDPDGSDLPDLAAARDEAAVLKGADPEGIGFEISDELGRNLLFVAFRTVLPPSICDLPAKPDW